MRRKLIKQGAGGLTVFLPIKWIRDHNLKKGDPVIIDEVEGRLNISSEESHNIKKKEVSIGELENISYIRSVISSLYKSGYNDITIYFKKMPDIHEINKIINTFTGLEVVEQTQKTIRIKSFLFTNQSEVESLIVKIFQTIKYLILDLQENGKKIDLNNHKSIIKNIRKIRDHCLRTIHKIKYFGDKSYDYYDFVTQLEKLAVNFFMMNQLVIDKKITDLELYLDANNLFESLYRSYLKKDFISSHKNWEKIRNKLKRIDLDKLIKKNKVDFVTQYYTILERLLHLASRLSSLSKD
jgi:hypothetical protein